MTLGSNDLSTCVPAIELIGDALATIDNAEQLEAWDHLPAYMAPGHLSQYPHNHYSSCSYCGVGDGVAARKAEQGCAPKASPSAGCVKFEYSRMKKSSAYPIQIAPSVKIGERPRANILYKDAIGHFADLLLDYLEEDAQILVYACGQIDYFAIFAMQEVFRILGVRNLTGNAEHCLNAGAVHNEILTGQEGPFVTIEQALAGHNKFYIFNGWNGSITHPPIFNQLIAKPDLRAVLFDVMLTETGQALKNKLSDACLGFIRPASDPHIALAVAHHIFEYYPEAIEQRFIQQWSDVSSFQEFKTLASDACYSPHAVAERAAPQPEFVEPLISLITGIASTLVEKGVVPVIVPSVGLSQSSGVVAHCLWACVLAMLGKFGLDTKGELIGGVLRLPGQINAESEVQGLSRKFFMGRIPMNHAAEAATRMGLPENAYAKVLEDEAIAALDYSEPSAKRQLFLFFGTQFEANMPNRKKWLAKLQSQGTKIVVVDPIVDDWTLEHATLIIPSPPHPATAKLYQNGEWRLSLSVPQKKAAAQTRSDATIIYDAMEALVARLSGDSSLQKKHPHLMEHLESGYLQRRFCNSNSTTTGLVRVDGEVSRVQLFARIQDYLGGGCGPLYCHFENNLRQPIEWDELLAQGSIIYGGVGTHRFTLDYDKQESPFADIYRKPRRFSFFLPSPQDLQIASGLILNSGRSSLSDHQRRVQFAIKSFNSGKATPVDDIPLQHPAHVSHLLAAKYELRTGDWVRISSASSENSLITPVVVSDRIFGETIYMSFHRSKMQALRGFYINDVTDNQARCAYSSQVKLKTPGIFLGKMTSDFVQKQFGVELSPSFAQEELPFWDESPRNFIVQHIIAEADNCTTFRLVPEQPCFINFMPGQYCTVNLNINGRKQARAYSISSSPGHKYGFDITVKRVEGGLVSNWLPDNTIEGDCLNIGTISGDFFLSREHATRKLLLIGAGSGVTPLMSMMRWLAIEAPNADVDFYISTRYLSDVLFADELIQIESNMPNANLWIIPTAEDYRHSKDILRGRISAEILKKTSPDFATREVFICGPEGFMETAKNVLLGLGHEIKHIHQESFGSQKQRPEKSAAQSLQVTFSSAGTQLAPPVSSDGSLSLLELAEEQNVGISSVCRAGICGACLIKVSGETQQEKTDQLTDDQLAEGYRLACICYPKAHCEIDVL